MVDEKGAMEHLRELEGALGDWDRYRDSIKLEDLQLDRDKRNMVLHAMLVAIQASIDIANHLVVEYGLRKPSTYRESFEALSEGGYLLPGLANDLADLAGFRNVLVHIYWQLNLEEAFEILRNDLKHLKKFRDWARKELSKWQT